MEEGNSGCKAPDKYPGTDLTADDIILHGMPQRVTVTYVIKQVWKDLLGALVLMLAPILIPLPWFKYLGLFGEPQQPLDLDLTMDLAASVLLALSILIMGIARIVEVVMARRLELAKAELAAVMWATGKLGVEVAPTKEEQPNG